MAKQITRRNEAWVQKSIAAQAAQSHTDKMDTHYGGLIAQAAYYTEEFDIPAPKVVINPPKQDTKIFCIAETTSQAIFHIAQQSFVASIYNCGYERIGALNFASFKNPGGMFIEGSMAQEESLCHDSFLYNVLRLKPEYYAKNRADVNRSLYYSNMLYSPNILFIDDEKIYRWK